MAKYLSVRGGCYSTERRKYVFQTSKKVEEQQLLQDDIHDKKTP